MKSIEQNGFNKSIRGWLGSGVYFFQDNIEVAMRYIKTAKPQNGSRGYAIIESLIEVPKDKLLDLVDPTLTPQCFEDFHECRQKMLLKLKQDKKNIIVASKEIHDAIVIDIVAEEKDYQVVRKATYTGNQIDKENKAFSFIGNAIELCVKNNKCIINSKYIPNDIVL